MTRIRMRKSALECGIVPQHQITLTLTPSFSQVKKPVARPHPSPLRHSARKEPNMPHSSPFLYKSLDQLASNNIHPRSLSSTRGFQQCPAQTAHSEGAPSNMLAQSIPYALRAIQSREHPLLDRKKAPHKRGATFYKTMRSFNRAWVQPSQAFDQERARREIYSAASSVAGFSALGAAAFFLG